MLQRKLAIVPVGENNSGIENPESKLNAIYLRYGIEWSVRMEPAFTDMSWSGEDGKLDAGKSGFFTAYTSEMKSLNRSFRSQRSVHEDEAYLFVFDTEAVNEDEDSGVLLGDMPIGYQFGYLFSNSLSSVTAKTIAHELGHGIFQLNHTFESSYAVAKSSTNNLMDYTEGVELVKQQWDAIYDPQILVTKFLQDDEEGEEKETKPLPGDPLLEMEIANPGSGKDGGMHGCTRFTGGCSIAGLKRKTGGSKPHKGTDLYAEQDTKLYSMHAGTVISIFDKVKRDQYFGGKKEKGVWYSKNYVGSLGNDIQIESFIKDKRVIIRYCHLNKINVKIGDKVRQGQYIGLTGRNGNAGKKVGYLRHQSNEPHLHIQIQTNTNTDPMDYLTTKFDDYGNKIK